MKQKSLFTACIVLTLVACKKDASTTEQPLLQEGPLSTQLGKRIYLGNHGHSRSTPFWGQSSDELFVTASTEILRVDLASQKLKVVENFGALVTGKTNENSGIIFLGNPNNQLGYYVFNFSSSNIEKIIAVPPNQGTLIDIAGSNIFYYLSPVSTPNPPCTGYCWPLPGPFVPGTFYHLDKQTHQITELTNKRFLLFSRDGTKAILASQLERRMYVFDNTSRTIVDSADITSTSTFGLFFLNGVLHSFEADALGTITIKNFSTGQILRQYQTNLVAMDSFRVSADGTKLYYSGGILNEHSMKILLYDIATNTEKTIADLPFLSGGGLPFDSFVLSEDNKKMVVHAGNDLYVKVLD